MTMMTEKDFRHVSAWLWHLTIDYLTTFYLRWNKQFLGVAMSVKNESCNFCDIYLFITCLPMQTRSIMHVMTLEVTEMFEDTKGLITSRISKDRQHNGQKKKNKRTNNDL
jgi:hypothetical protein